MPQTLTHVKTKRKCADYFIFPVFLSKKITKYLKRKISYSILL